MVIEGGLYIVGTPIGNLEDITLRAIRVLGEMDVVACEDTREGIKILNYFNIKKPLSLISYHKYNEKEKCHSIIKQVLEGKKIAIISDAGLPCISDPGKILIKEAIKKGIEPQIIPGPSAGISGLVISGLNTDSFYFAGFLPKNKKKDRQQFLKELVLIESTLIFYIAPHNLSKDLETILKVIGNRKVVLVRELTKKFEEVKRGTLEELLAWSIFKKPMGEMILYIAGGKNEIVQVDLDAAYELYLKLKSFGMKHKDAIKEVCDILSIKKNQFYDYMLLKKEAFLDE